jgi:tetratricopeptide (TPR) repeat protein
MGYFLIVLFPVLGLFEMSYAKISLVSDHLQYAAILGPIVLVASTASSRIAHLPRRPRVAAVVLAIAVVAVLGALSYARGFVFRSHRALWADVLAKNPDCPEAHYEIGKYLTDDADAERAAGHTEQADELIRQAIAHYDKALELRPKYSEAHNNLGHLYIRLQDMRLAGYHFARAVQIRPDNHRARLNLAIAQYRIGATREAAENFRRVLEASPDYVPALLNLARILATDPNADLRDGPTAVQLAQRARRLAEPASIEEVDAVDTLAMAYAEAGVFENARETGLRAAALARQIGQTALAEQILARVAIYEQRRPVRMTIVPPSSQAAR